MFKISGIHHVALKACGKETFDKTLDFYCNILNLPVARSWGEGEDSAVMIACGDSLLEIFANGDENLTEGALRHIAFDIDNVDECVVRIREAGYEITMEPTDICIPSQPAYPARIAFCTGPIGEIVELFCVKK